MRCQNRNKNRKPDVITVAEQKCKKKKNNKTQSSLVSLTNLPEQFSCEVSRSHMRATYTSRSAWRSMHLQKPRSLGKVTKSRQRPRCTQSERTQLSSLAHRHPSSLLDDDDVFFFFLFLHFDFNARRA